MKRRTVITAAVALPCLGVVGSATAATGNATDAAWSAYEAARARYAENDQTYDAFEATIPIGPRPTAADFGDLDKPEHRAEWDRQYDAWCRERAKYPANPFALDDDQLDAMCGPVWAAEDAIHAALASKMVDIERKLAVISNWGGCHIIEANRVDDILADVRRLNGTRMAGEANRDRSKLQQAPENAA